MNPKKFTMKRGGDFRLAPAFFSFQLLIFSH